MNLPVRMMEGPRSLEVLNSPGVGKGQWGNLRTVQGTGDLVMLSDGSLCHASQAFAQSHAVHYDSDANRTDYRGLQLNTTIENQVNVQ